MPDTATSRVVIQEVTKSVNITAPASTDGTWDVHIATMPELATSGYLKIANLSSAGKITYSGFSQTSTNLRAAPVMFCKVPSGENTFPSDDLTVTVLDAYFDVVSFDDFAFGQRRLIGMAFEVHNTTAEIYKQGAVLVYRLPQALSQEGLWFESTTPAAYEYKFGQASRLPPANLSQAQLLVGSRQWKAADGCYCVASHDIVRNDLAGTSFNHRLFSAGDLTNDGVTACMYTPSATQVSYPYKPTPFHTSGAYFTGLSHETTLTLTVKMIYEAVPTPENTQLVVLSQPSPSYDPVAIELYKAAINHLPPGVPVSQNASGDFWDGVLGIISKVAPIVGKIIPFPGAALIGEGIGNLAKSAQDNRNASDRDQRQGDFGANGNKNSVKPSSSKK